MRTAIRFVGRDYRQVLPESTTLAHAYTRRSGPEDPDAVEWATQVASCLAELGRTPTP